MSQAKLTPQQRLEIINKYKTGNFKGTQLAKEYGVVKSAIYQLLRNHKVKINNNLSQLFRKYTLDEMFFDKIDTQEKAYFLGFLYADGYHYEGNCSITLSLQERDKEILEKLNNVIKSNRPLQFVKTSRASDKRQNQYRLCISSIIMSKQLVKLKCIQNKSDFIELPTEDMVPEHLMNHFLRGFIDGDGHIGFDIRKHKNEHWYVCQCICSIVVNHLFGHQLCDFINNKFNFNINKLYKMQSSKVKTFQIGKLSQITVFLDWLYKDATIFLDRKYKNYLGIKEYYHSENKQEFLIKVMNKVIPEVFYQR